MTHLRGVKPALSPDRDPLRKVPPAPKHLGAHARAEWKRVLPRLIEDRLITRADLGGVEDLCIARGYVREIEEARRNGGALDHKLFGMLNRAMQLESDLSGHSLPKRQERNIADFATTEAHEADIAKALARRLFDH